MMMMMDDDDVDDHVMNEAKWMFESGGEWLMSEVIIQV
jgi:hypothetical protein